jgi:chromosome segregation ATPase
MYIIANEKFEAILETIIKKMNEVGDDSKRLRQWYDEAQVYIPTNSLYEGKYWIAAYIIYSNLSKFEELLDKLYEIKSDIRKLESELDHLSNIKFLLRGEIEVLRDEFETIHEDYQKSELQKEIEIYENELKNINKTYKEILAKYYKLENNRKILSKK